MLAIMVGVLFSLLESYLLFMLLDFILGKKEGCGLSFYLAILGDVIIVLLCNYLIMLPEVTIAAAAVYEAFISRRIIKGKMPPKILIILGYISMDFVIDLAAYILSTKILKVDFAGAYDMNMLNSMVTALSKLVLCAVVYIGIHIWKRRRNELSGKYVAMLCCVPLVSIWFLAALLGNGFQSGPQFLFQSSVFLYLTLFGILMINMLVFNIYGQILEAEKQQQNQRDLEQEENYYEELEVYYTYASEMRAAYEEHLKQIAELVKSREYDWLEQYLTEIQSTMERYQFMKFTDNKMIDAILSEKSFEAKSRGIEFYILTELLEERFKNPMYLCTLLGNILDHALETCERLMDKGASYTFIKVKLLKDKKIDGCLISVVNTCESPVSRFMPFRKQQDMQKKPETELKKIEKLIQRMEGNCTYGYDKKTFFFVARIPVQELPASA